MLLRRRFPLGVLLVVLTASGVQYVYGGDTFQPFFAFVLALYAVAAHSDLRRAVLGGVIGAASRRDILFKSGAALEAAGKLRAMAFDKTGTLTEGCPVLSRVAVLDGRDEAVTLSRAAERAIKQNVFISVLIKGPFVVLVPFGLAVLADMGASIAVTLNGLRLFGRGLKG